MKLENGRFLKITELFAFVSRDKKGHEGIMAFLNSNGTMMPMIGADIERVEQLVPVAELVKKKSGMDYEIRYFVQKQPRDAQ